MSRKCIVALAYALSVLGSPAQATNVDGPGAVNLPDAMAKLKLPAGYLFVDKEEAKKALEKEGSTGKGVIGVIVPTTQEKNNFVVICRFDDVGYVNDDDAAKLNADDILNSYKEGTKEQNENRKEHGVPPIYVAGWAESPHYDKAKHQVIWAIQAKDSESATAPVTGVNYNTRILGRHGVLSMNLVTDPDKLDLNKPKVAQLLNNTTFDQGQSYADYKPGKDKSAGYGIAGLILGGGAVAAAAKLGFFGLIAKWGLGLLLVFKKFAIIIALGGAGLLSKFFKREKKDKV